VLRIRTWDPVPFSPLDPGWVQNHDPDLGSGSEMNIHEHISECLEIVFGLKTVLRIRIHLFLGLQDPDADPLVRGVDPDPSFIMQK
jgi:hypothetical protein